MAAPMVGRVLGNCKGISRIYDFCMKKMNDVDLSEIPFPSDKAELDTKKLKIKRTLMHRTEDKREDQSLAIKIEKSGESCSEKSPNLTIKVERNEDRHVQSLTLGETIKKRIKSEMNNATMSGSKSAIDDKVRSDIVDEMFRDFLAQKMELVEQEYIRKRHLRSDEDKLSGATDDSETENKQSNKNKRKHKAEEHKIKRSSGKRPKTTSLLCFETNDEMTANIDSTCTRAEEDVSLAPTCVPVSTDNTSKVTVSTEATSSETAADSRLILDYRDLHVTCHNYSAKSTATIPNVVVTTKTTVATSSSQTKKPVIPLKISSASASLISSGKIILQPGKKKKLLEDGEVISTGSDESTDESDDDKNDNYVKLERKHQDEGHETGSLTDTDDGIDATKSKKKKKKHKHKSVKVKKKKKKKKKKTKKKKSGRSRSPSRSPKVRSVSPCQSRERYIESSPTRCDRKWIAEKGKPMVIYTTSYRLRHGMPERRHARSHSRSTASKDKHSVRVVHHSRERSRSKERKTDRDSMDLQINKSKLRKIAIANAVHMMKIGETSTVSSDTMAKIRSGGKSVEELTDYCKKISDKEKEKLIERELRRDDSLSNSSEDCQEDKSEEEDFTIHHPFSVKEAPNIVMNIRNSKQLPVLTPQEKVTESAKLRLTFPVSSGSQHRAKESEWVPVEKTAATSVSSAVTAVVKAEQATTTKTEGTSAFTAIPATITTAAESAIEVASVQVPKKDKVFLDQPAMPIDIGSIVSERLTAVRRLQKNPNDVQAISQMRTAQKKASQWAESKMLPGQFIGSTGATILSQEQLIGPDKKRQAWARKEQLTTAAPLSGGIGMLLLQKLGWKQGEGLGKNKDGPQAPLMLDVKIDRKGLSSQGEGQRKVPAPRANRVPARDLSGKHPVSALVELCSKRRWGTPEFILVDENGPAHKKNFLFKVAVHGVEYQSSLTSNNKKQAKAQAATVCLQELGLVPC